MKGLAAALALALLAAGCAGGTPEGTPGGTGSPSPAASSTGDPPGGDGSPTGDPTGVPAADGPVIDQAGFELRVPRGYEVDDTYDLSISALDVETQDSIFVGNHEGVDREPLAALARESEQLGMWKGAPRRLASVTIAGERWYHLSGRQIAAPHAEEFGTWHAGTQVRLTFLSWSGVAQRQRTVDSVLASFAWH